MFYALNGVTKFLVPFTVVKNCDMLCVSVYTHPVTELLSIVISVLIGAVESTSLNRL